MVTVPTVIRIAFTAIVLAVGLQRLAEVRTSARHERELRAAGGREHAPGQMAWMRLVHGGWLAGTIVEVWALDRPFVPALAVAAGAVFAIGQTLRVLAMRSLGKRWTVKIITLPGAEPVSGGVYRFVRHPNYLGVVLEIAALPLVHGAWITALAATVANALLLRARIGAEEAALSADNGYAEALGDRPRFIPR